VADDAGVRILLVGQHRAAFEASGLEAVVTSAGDVLNHRKRDGPADEQPDVAPRLIFVQPVEIVACRHARLAARARVEIDLE
jgi:hypothetical protein